MPCPKGARVGHEWVGAWRKERERAETRATPNDSAPSAASSLHHLSRSASSLAGDAYENSNRQPAREHERSAIAEERQRNACDGHEIDRHADVLEHVHEPTREQSKRDETAERIVRAFGDANYAQEKRKKEHHAESDANEPEFFPDDRPDEISVLRRQERETLLRTVQVALSEPPAGSDRHLRLNDVIA